MSKQGTLNFIGMLLLPLGAMVGARLATSSGVWQAYGDTYIMLAVINSVITVPAAIISGFLLRRSTGILARWIAITPCIVPSVYGTVWYIWRGLFPAEVAAGAEYIGAPQYLLIGMLVITLFVLLLRVTGLVPRSA
ncbi:MAG: hypothetical protein QF790_10605 [Gammaproteobacteria bacterium]|jgi:hypothetical protein|nr:hypothetical protein [Gammaproteobacteria bacterium]MDP6617604.1 hypothetical protein [Gammaproteobacteria bacterium]MDP6694481.1 hypothetical protein [Gammaproteobacteria bacterium]